VVSPGDELRAGDKVIGRVTSAAFSPALGRTIALGYVQRESAAPGTRVDAFHDTLPERLTVVPLPFLGRDAAAHLP